MNKQSTTLVIIFLTAVCAAWIALPRSVTLTIPGVSQQITLSHQLPIPLTSYTIAHDYQLKTGLDIQGGSHLLFEADMSNVASDDRISALQAAENNIRTRIDQFGVSEPVVQTSIVADQYRLIVELPGITQVSQAVQLIGATAQLDFRVPDESTSEPRFIATGLTGKNLKRAIPTTDSTTGQQVVQLQFDNEGTKLFAEITSKYVGKSVGIFLDNQPVSLPRVNEPIVSGSAIISGDFTTETAKQLAVQLNAGSLPVPIKLIQQQSIGASLGQESINRSILAGGIGLATVMLFMMLYYGKLGVLATLGLILYAIITLAIYKLIGITLTLPGIAGFILSVGMAVDANILIFERFKEELSMGQPRHFAIEQAFGRAWDSIRDANICTIATGTILYYFTSGSVRGFALTLILGIIISLFTGIIVTRSLIRTIFPSPRKIKTYR